MAQTQTYTPLVNLPVESSVFAKCLEEKNRLKKEQEAEDKRRNVDPFVNKYNELRKLIEDTEKLKGLVSKAVGKAMSTNQNTILLYPNSDICSNTWSLDRRSASLTDTMARNIFTTIQYGDVILVNLLKDKLGREFEVKASSWGTFEITVAWKSDNDGKCIIL